ncbi:MAG: hypothetical protein HOP24_05120 [Sideroxydans sp.]|nr:hypothetical protein [Sideroxydans sp.]
MFALAAVAVLTVYLGISFLVVRWAIGYAKKNGKSRMRWGAGAALVMFMIPCWDWLPTVAMHKYFCEKEAGFWVYKTLDQWKAENPGVMETLPVPNPETIATKYEPIGDGNGKRVTDFLNVRFSWIDTQQDIFSLLPIIRTEQVVTDVQKHEVLARYVDFGSGYSIKNPESSFWSLSQQGNCSGGGISEDKMRNFRNNFYESKK